VLVGGRHGGHAAGRVRRPGPVRRGPAAAAPVAWRAMCIGVACDQSYRVLHFALPKAAAAQLKAGGLAVVPLPLAGQEVGHAGQRPDASDHRGGLVVLHIGG
jgi:hypothetical protein